jgi:hypothetical protein
MRKGEGECGSWGKEGASQVVLKGLLDDKRKDFDRRKHYHPEA